MLRVTRHEYQMLLLMNMDKSHKANRNHRWWSWWRCHARRDTSAWETWSLGYLGTLARGRRLVTDRHGPAAMHRVISAYVRQAAMPIPSAILYRAARSVLALAGMTID